MPERYWLVHPNGGRQLIDPRQFDLTHLAEQARRIGGRLAGGTGAGGSSGHAEQARRMGGRLVVESFAAGSQGHAEPVGRLFEPPLSAVGPLFRSRLDRIHDCLVAYHLDINARPTNRVLGGYYKTRRLVRVYSHDRELGRRPLEELFDTFLHEVAHHLEYTEPDTFHGRACGRVPGRMHSRLFWRILGELKGRWAELQRRR